MTAPKARTPGKAPQKARDERNAPIAHTVTPLRVLLATAPSGGEVRFFKHGDFGFPELSWYTGTLTADEEGTFWQARLAAEKAGLDQWQRAVALLRAAGWTIERET